MIYFTHLELSTDLLNYSNWRNERVKFSDFIISENYFLYHKEIFFVYGQNKYSYIRKMTIFF
jgi:hypothetical protein